MGDGALIQYTAKLAMESNQRFQCLVCHERLAKPIKFCRAGHLFCQPCRGRLNDCALCHADFSDDINITLDQILESSTFPCKNEIFGCKAIALYSEITRHEDVACDFKQGQCPLNTDQGNTACKENVVLCSFDDHIKNQHLYREKSSFGDPIRLDILIDANQNSKRVEAIEIMRGEESYLFCPSSLFFLERITYNSQNKILAISYHYVGLIRDAEKYKYSLKLEDEKNSALITTHQNKCLPIGLSNPNVLNSGKCFVIGLSTLMNANEHRKRISLSLQLDYAVKKEKIWNFDFKNASEEKEKKTKCSLEEKDGEVNDDSIKEERNKSTVKIEELPEDEEIICKANKPEKEEISEEEREIKRQCTGEKNVEVKNESFVDKIKKWFSIMLALLAFVVQIFIYLYMLK